MSPADIERAIYIGAAALLVVMVTTIVLAPVGAIVVAAGFFVFALGFYAASEVAVRVHRASRAR